MIRALKVRDFQNNQQKTYLIDKKYKQLVAIDTMYVPSLR